MIQGMSRIAMFRTVEELLVPPVIVIVNDWRDNHSLTPHDAYHSLTPHDSSHFCSPLLDVRVGEHCHLMHCHLVSVWSFFLDQSSCSHVCCECQSDPLESHI